MIKSIFKITFLFLITTSCKKDFKGEVNPLVESYKMPEDESVNIIFKHNNSAYLIGYEEENYPEKYDFDPYNVYSFDIESGRFNLIEKRIEPKLEYWSGNDNKIMLATSCNNEVYVLTQEKEFIKLKSDFSYNERNLIERFVKAVSLFSFNNLIFISLSDGELITYDPVTKLFSETSFNGGTVTQIIRKDNFFYLASGRSVYKSVDCKSWEIHFTINSDDQLLNINLHNGSFICASKSGENLYTLKLDFHTGENIVRFTDPPNFSKTSSNSDSNDDDDDYYNYDYYDYYDNDYVSYTTKGRTGYSYIIDNYYFSFVDEFGYSDYYSFEKKTKPTFPLVSENISTSKTKVADGSVFNNQLRSSRNNNLNIIQIENYLFYLDNLYEESDISYTNRSRLKKVTIPTN
jgi:hypothetical protein